MDLDRALAFAADNQKGILITLRRDGRPQSSNIVYVMDGPVARVSITDDAIVAAANDEGIAIVGRPVS